MVEPIGAGAATKSPLRSKSEYVADGLRDMILSGELGSGSTLRQRDIAKQFGVSPTPVREALQQLEAEGYILSKRHHSAIVVRPTEERISENFLVRAALEALAIELAARKITPKTLAELEAINAMIAACDPREPRRFELNRRFHFTLYESAESPTLLSLLTYLWELLSEGPGHGRPVAEAVAEHAAIIHALRQGDARGAALELRKHIEGGEQYEAENAREEAGVHR